MRQLKTIFLSFLLVTILVACKSNDKSKTVSKEVDEKLEKPNIIWLMAEDISIDLECYGLPDVKTPNLNKMASEGVLFNNAFVTNPICSPSRSAMMVGTHQVKTNTHHHRSNREIPLDSTFAPFTALLRNAGYTTILGHHAVFQKGRKIDVNFKHKPLGEWDGKIQFGLFDKYDTFEKEDEPFFAQIQLKVTHRGDWWDDIRQQSERPIHPDTVTLPPYMADHPAIRLDWAKYLDQIEFMDKEVGMIFQELEEKGLKDNTIVVFIADNGRCNIRGKGYLHDPGLHIPLIIYHPKKNKAGSVRKEVVSATDITATIIDFAGIDVPSYMTGNPIFSENFNREYVYAARDLWDEVEEKSRAITSGEWSYVRNDKPEVPYDAHQAYLEFYRPAVHVMRTLYKEGQLNENQKPFFETTKPSEELYNLNDDPHQLHNLANHSDFKSVLKELREATKKLDKELAPISDTYVPTKMTSPQAVEWLKRELPADYARMLAGEEIGYKRIMNLYKQSQLKTNN